MKKINIIAAAIALVFSASCNRELEFQHETFATLDAVNFSIDETAGKVRIPMSIYNPTGSEVKVTVTCTDGSAKASEDYEVTYPATGVLTFSGNTCNDTLEIAIKAFEGVFTNNKVFTVQIASATEGVGVGNLSTAKVTIKDIDHPLANILGEYTANDDGDTWDVTFDKNDESVQKINVISLSNSGETLVGDVSEDQKVITIPFGQEYESGGYTIVFVGYGPGGYFKPSGNLILTKTEAGWVQSTDVDDDEMSWGIGALAVDASGSPLGWWGYYYPGVILTKK